MAAATETRLGAAPPEEDEPPQSHSEPFKGMKISPRIIMHYKLPFTLMH